MTACSKAQDTSMGKKAVSAALAGTLAVGMVPGVALAASAETTETGDGISALIAGDAFTGGTVDQAYAWSQGQESTSTDWKSGALKIEATGDPINVVPVSITPFGGSQIQVADYDEYDGTASPATLASYTMNDGYSLTYYVNDDGKKGAQVGSVVYPGKYLAVVTATSGAYQGQEISLAFEVTPKQLQGALIYNMDAAGNQDSANVTASPSVTYTGATQNLGVCIPDPDDSSKLVPLAAGDYSIKWLPGGSNVNAPGVNVVDAGTYFAVVTGTGIYEGSTAATPTITVNPFNLGTATYVVPDTTSSTYPTSVASATAADGTKLADLSLIKLSLQDNVLWNKDAQYTLDVTTTTKNDPNFTSVDAQGDKTQAVATVNKVAALATFNYGNAPLADTKVNASEKTEFDITKITAWNGKDQLKATGTTPAFDPTKDVTVSDPTGAVDNTTAASNLAANKPGTYTVTATVKPDTDFTVGGTKVVTVTVIEGVVDATNNLFVSYAADGSKFVGTTAITETYNGTGINAAQIKWNIKGADGNSIGNGTGASDGVTVTNAEGKKVAWPIVAAGDYTVTFDMSDWEVTGANTLPITIEKLNLTKDNILLSKSNSDLTGNVADDPATTDKDESVTNNPNLVVKTAKFGYQWIDTTADVALPTNVWVKTGKKANTSADSYGKFQYDDTALASVTWEQYDAEKNVWSPVTTLKADTDAKVRAIVTAANKNAADNFVFSDAANNQTVLEYNAVPVSAIEYMDVLPGKWYFNPISLASENGYMSGYDGQMLFGPNDSTDRAMAACVLFNMAGEGKILDNEGAVEETGYQSFDDVRVNDYFAKAVAWGKNANILHGFAGTKNYGPYQNVTREQWAVMLWNYATALDSSTLAGIDVDKVLATKADGAKVSDWAREAVAWAVENGIMGNNGQPINPQGNITRAELAAMAVNFQPEPIVKPTA